MRTRREWQRHSPRHLLTIYKRMNHPYQELEAESRWKVIEEGINELEDNQDITVTTKQAYVVGYLLKKIIESEKQTDTQPEATKRPSET